MSSNPAVSDVIKAGNTAVITGASSGIGRATALDFVGKGMNVWMLDIDKGELDAAKELVLSKKVNDTQVSRKKKGFIAIAVDSKPF